MSFDLKISQGNLVLKNGQLQTVIDTEKVVQDVLKICLTSAGSNPLHPWYGSFISRTMVGSALDTSITIQVAKSQLNTALDNLKKLQDLQLKSYQRMSAAEQISSILDISVKRNNLEPRLYDIKIVILTKNMKSVPVEFRISPI